MKKSTLLFFSAILTLVYATTAQAQYQIGNSDFEYWADTNEPGNGWYSFVSGGGDMASLGIPFSKGNTTKTTGHSGNGVQIKSSGILGKNANGNLTTGKINLGSTTPTATSNYNYTARGTKNCCVFSGRPDAMEYWGKYSRGSSGGTYVGRAKAIIHGNYDYKDPYETAANEARYKIGECIVNAEVTSTWKKFSANFTYTGTDTALVSYLLVSFTTNPTPGGSKNDYFQIDDVKFIYNSGIKSIKVNGMPVSDFDEDKYTYDINEIFQPGSLTNNGKSVKSTVSDPYAFSLRHTLALGGTNIEVEDNTEAGVADVSGEYDTTTFQYKLTVKGQDYSVNPSNVHTYTLQFLDPSTGIDQITTDTDDNGKHAGTFDLQGRRISDTKHLPAGVYVVNGKKTLVK